VHDLEGIVDLGERLAVGDDCGLSASEAHGNQGNSRTIVRPWELTLIDLQLSGHVVVNQVGKLGTSLDSSESTSLPHSSSNELEGAGRDLLSGSGNTDDDGLSPSLVAGLKSGSHDTDITSAVESVVESTVGDLNKVVLDRLSNLGGVNELGSTELLGPLLLSIVDIDDNDASGSVLNSSLDDGQSDTSGSEDGNGRALLNVGGDDGSSVSGGDTTSEQAGAVHGGLGGDGNDGDVGDNGVLGEGGASHEVEEVLSLAAETGGSIRHQSTSLGGSDLSAKVGLACGLDAVDFQS
jgi:hypothetical protein